MRAQSEFLPKGLAIGLAIASIVRLAPAVAQQVEPDFDALIEPPPTKVELRVGAASTDNAFRTPGAKVDDVLASVGLGLDYALDRRQVDVDLLADIDYIEYLDDTYEGEARGYFNGSAAWTSSNEVFRWFAQDTFGQVVNDPLTALTPGNLENVNYFTTGPSLQFNLAQNLRLSLFGTYSISTYEESNFDYDSRSAGLSLMRALGNESQIGLNAITQRSEFDDPALQGFDTREVSLRYVLRGSRTGLSLDAGYTELRGDDNTDSSRPLIRVDVQRRISPSSVLFAQASQQFSSAGDQLRGELGSQVAPGAMSTVASADPFEERRVEVGWAFERRRTGLTLSVGQTQDEYETQVGLNREAVEANAELTRRMTPTMTGRLTGVYRDYEYENQGFDAQELDLGLDITKYFGRSLGLSFRYIYSDRSASVPTAEYTENRFGLRLSYYPGGRR